MKVLRVLANPKPVEKSASLKIERAFMEVFGAKHPEAEVDTLDLYRDEVPLLDEKLLPAFFGGAPADEETARRRGVQQAILERFLAADLVVIATPMWNFNAPPMLKAFIDTILVARKTFRYVSGGSEGLAGAKKVIVCNASGGIYEEETLVNDMLTPMLKVQFGFIGITDITFIKAPGQALGGAAAAERTAAAIARAKEVAAAI